MFILKNIVLNNSLLLKYLILESSNYCKLSRSTIARPLLNILRQILSRLVLLEDFIFLNFRSFSNIEYSIKYKYDKWTNFTHISSE